LSAAAARLEHLQSAAGRPDRATPGHGDAAADAVRAALAADLDVPGALSIAEESGGSAARAAGSLLGLFIPEWPR
jgi:cysteinyl-tRNA synthetase